MKKVLSLVMVIAMVLSSMTFAFAEFKDVPATNAELTQATGLLSALGIINGYEDGSFKPENSVTRAEMAKMMIAALGYGDIATDTPVFTDCQKHWAKGYISLANDLGIIEGVGNNKFDPDSKVTYEQATAMLLRTLGYTNENLNGGKSTTYNSAAYKTKALSLGLYAPLKSIDMKAAANRGDIALMLNVNLQQGLVMTNEFGRPGFIGELLVGKLATKANITSVSLDDMAAENKNLVDLTPYLFQNIDVYKVGKSVVYVADNNSYVVEGTFSKSEAGKLVVTTADDATVELSVAGLTEATQYVNGAMATTSKDIDAIAGGSGKVVYNNTTKTATAVIYEKLDDPKPVVTTYKTGKTIFTGYQLPTDKNGKVDFTQITVTGDATSLEDIKANDIIEVAMADGNAVMHVVVTRNTIEGKVTKIASGKYYINGTAYQLNDATLESIDLGFTGTFYLDSNGLICKKVATQATVTTIYGIVEDFGTGLLASDGFSTTSISRLPKVKLVGMDGKTVVLDIVCKKDCTGVATGLKVTPNGENANILEADFAEEVSSKAEVGNGTLVEYTVNADGQVTSMKPVETATNASPMATSDKNFLANDKTVILNYGTVSQAFTVVKVSDLSTDKMTFQYVGDAVYGWDLVIVTDQIADTSAPVYGFITAVADTLDANGNPINEVTALIDGATKTFVTEDATLKSTLTGLVNQFAKVTIDGTIITAAEAESGEAVTVETVTDKYIVLDGESIRTYLADNFTVYKVDATGKVTIGDLADVDFVKDETTKYTIRIIKVDNVITNIIIVPAV